MKSLDTIIFAVLDGIFKDAVGACPTYRDSHIDKARVRALYESRGISSLMIDLPGLRHLLLRGLESGVLVLEGPLSKAVSTRVRVPAFLRGLWSLIFHNNGDLRSEPCPNAILYISQITCFCKSLELECSPDRKDATVGEYYDIESELRRPTLSWGDSILGDSSAFHTVHFCDGMDDTIPTLPVKGREDPRLWGLVTRLQRVCDSVSGYLGYYDPYAFTNAVGYARTKGRTLSHGRGSVSDQPRGGNRYQFPNWSERLQAYFPYDAFASHCFDVDNMSVGDVPSKLIAVPKDLSKPRLIASEPTANQWAQQITMRYLVDVINNTPLSIFIDLSRQDLSQQLVRSSSLDRSLATVDLSSASDRLSCWSIERAFRKNPLFLEILNSHRTPIIRDGVTNRDSILLKKFASQGTAVTFPIQTIFFLCCVIASLGFDGLEKAKSVKGKVRVYGDDIILPVSGLENLKLLLGYLQLKVNVKKTFSNGSFRESCGLDCYKGHNVTPVKPKKLLVRGPQTLQAVLDTSNNLYLQGHWCASEALLSTIPRRFVKHFPVVQAGLGVSGLQSYVGSEFSHLKRRYNKDLHVWQYQCVVFRTSRRLSKATDSSPFLQFLAENPSPLTEWESGFGGETQVRTGLGWEALEAGL